MYFRYRMPEKISELRRFNGFERAMTQAGPKTVRGAASRTILRVVTLGVGASAQARRFGAAFCRGWLSGEGEPPGRVLTATAQVIMETKN